MAIREVWKSNFNLEMSILLRCLHDCEFLSVDSEFPGFLIQTPRFAPEASAYNNLKHNVDNLKIIQLGVTLCMSHGEGARVYMTWQFNFSDFDRETDPYNESSIRLLTGHGIDFERLKMQGIDSKIFGCMFIQEVLRVGTTKPLRWVTFHGLYDMAYLLKAVTRRPLPATSSAFTAELGKLLGLVYDVKHMARFCEGMRGGEIGLEKAAEIMGVKRVGVSHQGGSDSLLTALVFAKMEEDIDLDGSFCEGFLYGIETRIICRRPIPIMVMISPRRPPAIYGAPPPMVRCAGKAPLAMPIYY